jgi:hypothetical protein
VESGRVVESLAAKSAARLPRFVSTCSGAVPPLRWPRLHLRKAWAGGIPDSERPARFCFGRALARRPPRIEIADVRQVRDQVLECARAARPRLMRRVRLRRTWRRRTRTRGRSFRGVGGDTSRSSMSRWSRSEKANRCAGVIAFPVTGLCQANRVRTSANGDHSRTLRAHRSPAKARKSPNQREPLQTARSSRQAGGHWFEPSTAHRGRPARRGFSFSATRTRSAACAQKCAHSFRNLVSADNVSRSHRVES